MLALVSKVFRHGGGVVGTLHAQQRWGVGRSGHHHRAGSAVFAQDVLNKFFNLSAPLANQAHHNHIGLGVAGHHAQQHTFAHARPSKQAQTLATPHR